jgi:hypothetical protein
LAKAAASLDEGGLLRFEMNISRADRLLGPQDPTQSQTRYFALDHLGSVRAIADGAGSLVETRSYEPYGFNPVPVTFEERRAWAGHERDYAEIGKPEDDLDDMHARLYMVAWGRFLSVDPGRETSGVGAPQIWNRCICSLGTPSSSPTPMAETQRSSSQRSAWQGSATRLT